MSTLRAILTVSLATLLLAAPAACSDDNQNPGPLPSDEDEITDIADSATEDGAETDPSVEDGAGDTPLDQAPDEVADVPDTVEEVTDTADGSIEDPPVDTEEDPPVDVADAVDMADSPDTSDPVDTTDVPLDLADGDVPPDLDLDTADPDIVDLVEEDMLVDDPDPAPDTPDIVADPADVPPPECGGAAGACPAGQCCNFHGVCVSPTPICLSFGAISETSAEVFIISTEPFNGFSHRFTTTGVTTVVTGVTAGDAFDAEPGLVSALTTGPDKVFLGGGSPEQVLPAMAEATLLYTMEFTASDPGGGDPPAFACFDEWIFSYNDGVSDPVSVEPVGEPPTVNFDWVGFTMFPHNCFRW